MRKEILQFALRTAHQILLCTIILCLPSILPSCGDDQPENPTTTQNPADSGNDDTSDPTDPSDNDPTDPSDDDPTSPSDNDPTNPSDDDPLNQNDTEAINEKLANDYRRGAVSSTLSGYGTKSSPYLVSTAADLRLISDQCRAGDSFEGKYFKMTRDITINTGVLNSDGSLRPSSSFEQWIPIGVEGGASSRFCGNFDGGGYTVYGIYIERSDGIDAGLFGRCGGVDISSKISNLTIKDSYISSKGDLSPVVGGIVGWMSTTYYDNVHLENCHNYATIVSNGHAGGIVGFMTAGKMILCKCSNHGYIYSTDGDAGGICGIFREVKYSGQVYDCWNSGKVEGSDNSGGIIGYLDNNTLAINCLNTGTVLTSNNGGGIVGYLTDDASIKNCVNIGLVTGTSSQNYVGGIVGNATKGNYITRCFYLSSKTPKGYGYRSGCRWSENSALFTEAEMKMPEVITSLNTYKDKNSCSWCSGLDGFPMLECFM